MSELRSCVVEAMIRGYHEYQSIWKAEIGENLTCIREPGNVRDPYAVAVTKSESSTIVGHVPRKMSAICLLFLRKGGSIFRKWLANATNSAFSVQHALWFISTTPILLISCAGGTAHARAKSTGRQVIPYSGKFSRYKISRIHPDPRKQRKLIPSKISRYTVVPHSTK